MALIQDSIDSGDKIIALSRREALSLVALLTAQLAGEPLDRHSTGECPSFVVFPDEGSSEGTRYTFVLDRCR